MKIKIKKSNKLSWFFLILALITIPGIFFFEDYSSLSNLLFILMFIFVFLVIIFVENEKEINKVDKIIGRFGRWEIVFNYDQDGRANKFEDFGFLNEVEMMLYVTDEQKNRIGKTINLSEVVSWKEIKSRLQIVTKQINKKKDKK